MMFQKQHNVDSAIKKTATKGLVDNLFAATTAMKKLDRSVGGNWRTIDERVSSANQPYLFLESNGGGAPATIILGLVPQNDIFVLYDLVISRLASTYLDYDPKTLPSEVRVYFSIQ